MAMTVLRIRPLALLTASLLAASGCGFGKSTPPESPKTPPPVPTSPATAAAKAPEAPSPQRVLGSIPSLAPLVESVKAAVVNVDVAAQARNPQMADPFAQFFGGPRRAPPVQQGSGSGFIIDPKGRVLTNNHVVENAVSIRVRLDDGRAFGAKVLGRDPLTDLALLQLDGVEQDLPAVKLGNSDVMKVGDYVVAIGNPFGLASSVSAGILSARARDIHSGPYDDFLQTDAAINPGNSGGPLFNLQGEVIGINSAIIGGATGIGFAVPASTAMALLPQLEAGEVRRGWLGVAIQDLTPDLASALAVSAKGGAVVSDVTRGTPAAKAGLRSDDVVVSVDGQPVESSRELTRTIGFKRPGSTVTLGILRGGKEDQVKVELGERPDFEHVGRIQPARSDSEDKAGRLGIALGNDGSGEGAAILDVTPGSRADHAGLRPGMTIVEAGGEPVRSAREFVDKVSRAPSGRTLLLRVDVEGTRVLRALPVP